ncbi:MAG: stage 0 sporulation family protein [Clostridia bacterium]|nr:stage 0 sporulation family protein [Clostridia bacterium]
MTSVISVKFKEGGRAYYFSPDGKTYNIGDNVIVETSGGNAFGFVSKGNHEVSDESIVGELKKVLRAASDKDLNRIKENKEKEKDAFAICEKKIAEHGLDMKLVEVEYAFDASKITFFFTADGRVDFRELVKDLASSFHTRIELRQIGVRDEARMLGGIGICGQPYCCKRFLDDFQPVSIKMAKEQGLSLNPTKISGSCGRLMCCLKYEQESYEHLLSITPTVGSTVKIAEGVGTVVDCNLITGNLLVKPENSEGAPFKVHRSAVKLLSRPKRKKKDEEEEIME